MAAMHRAYQAVQIFKIVVVVRQQKTAFDYSLNEMNGVISACNTNVCRKAYIVAGSVQQPNQQCRRAIIV